jgi:hypothetical protein
MKWNKLYQYPKSIRSLIKDERHYEIGSSKLPSVTTILSATQSDEKRESLQKWKDKVGMFEAERIKNRAATTWNSYALVFRIPFKRSRTARFEQRRTRVARNMAQTIIDKGLGDLS